MAIPRVQAGRMWGAAVLMPHLLALVAVVATLGVVGLLQSTVVDLPAAILLYLVPIVLAASRWGRGPAITAVVAAILGHDLLFVDPRGTFTIERADEALGLVLLLFAALVTAQLADGARRGAEKEREAAVVRRSDDLKTALLRAVTHNLAPRWPRSKPAFRACDSPRRRLPRKTGPSCWPKSRRKQTDWIGWSAICWTHRGLKPAA